MAEPTPIRHEQVDRFERHYTPTELARAMASRREHGAADIPGRGRRAEDREYRPAEQAGARMG
jgi:hypothetical protein